MCDCSRGKSWKKLHAKQLKRAIADMKDVDNSKHELKYSLLDKYKLEKERANFMHLSQLGQLKVEKIGIVHSITG